MKVDHVSYRFDAFISAFFKCSSSIIFCLDENALIYELNPAAEKILKSSRNHLLGADFIRACEEKNIVFPLNKENLLSQAVAINGSVSESIDNKMHSIFLEWTIIPIFVEKEKQGILIICDDVTSYKVAEDKENKIDSYLDTIVNNLPHFIFWKDTNSRFLGCNKKFSGAVGLSGPSDIVGRTDYDMPWSQEQSDAFVKDDEDIIHTGATKLNYEESQKQIDGTEKIMLVSKVPMQDKNGNITGVLGIYSDITDRKKIEEEIRIAKERAELANKSKSEFLAVVSHELRIPLTGILGMIEFLKSEELSSDERLKYLAYLDKSGKHLLSLINDVLDFAKFESDKLEIVLGRIHLRQTIEEALSILVGSAKAKNLELILNYPSDIPCYVIGDSWSLKRVLVNLISNAIKFTNQGAITVNVDCSQFDDEAGDFIISIEDTGIGIPHEKMDALFNRQHDQPKSQTSTGLGLAITKKLIEMMGGRIDVSSELGKGSSFSFHLRFAFDNPLLKKAPSNENTISPVKELNHKRTAPRVLLVEDDLIIRIIHAKYLKQLGCDLVIAETGAQALRFAQQSFDLILMDVGLPEIDGFDVTRIIRQSINGSKDAFIVGLTGYSDYETHEKCLFSGMNDVLVKPIQLNDLKKLVDLIKKSQKAENFC